MKRIVIDFEFTGLKILEVELLQFTVLFVDEDKILFEIDELIKFETNYNEVDESTKKGLQFNKINSQEDLDKHNSKAKNLKEILEIFLERVKEFSNGKLGLTGWNNAGGDNIILRRMMQRYNYNYDEYFDYHSRDIMCMFLPIYENKFKEKISFHLKDAHKYLIGTIDDKKFHDARYDCIATLDIDLWIHKKIKENLK
jgi:hypothetical protein